MANINRNFLNLAETYLFTEIARRVKDFTEANPDKKLLRLGIGDVTLPLPKTVVDALEKASAEQGVAATFRGYGPEQGYDFLRNSILSYYAELGVTVQDDEIFVSDGAKSDLGNITDLFSSDNIVLIPDPVYPVYVDTNIMNGRQIVYADANAGNAFLPGPPDIHTDIIYICSPNNPTGSVYDRDGLKAWVDYAIANDAIILYDAAYESFISDKKYPRSIFEIEGARNCAIEFCSFSKTAGFTGLRCGYTVIPQELGKKDGISYNSLWLRRQTTKFNGVPYIVQRGAEAVFTLEGRKEIQANTEYYKENARILADAFDTLGFSYIGGKNSPYIWLTCPDGMDSWAFFDLLLNDLQIVGTPGVGFGKNGEGHFRFSAFGNRETVEEAADRLKKHFSK